MSGLNQCTYSFTSSTPLVQYYRVCITCTRNNNANNNAAHADANLMNGSEEEVVICINCSAICHDGHKLSTVLRQKMFCHCSLKNGGSHCRVLPRDRRHEYDDDSDDCSGCGDMSHSHSHHGHHHPSSSSKKRKYNTISAGHDHCHGHAHGGHGHDHDHCEGVNGGDTSNVCANNNSHSLILWSRFSKHDQQKKVLQQSHLMNIEDANRLAKETFVKSNPWTMSEQDIWNDPQFSMSENKFHHLQLKIMKLPRNSDIPEVWEVGVDSADHFLEEFCSFHTKGEVSSNSPSSSTSAKKPAAPSSAVPSASRSFTKTPTKRVILPEVNSEDDEERVIFAPSEEVAGEVEDGKKKKGSRPKKEAGAPKGPTPSYMIYCNMTRDQHQAANPGASMIELTKIIAQIWKNLPAEQKVFYEDLAKADKAR